MIEVKNLKKRYGNKLAVNDVSFTVENGEILGFLGPNGAGKSTTMNIITGYLSSTEGTVTIDGCEILEDPIGAKSKIGYLPEFPPLYLDMTVIKYLEFMYDLKKVKLPKKAHIAEVCDLIKITHVKDRVIKNLSKGYKQRVGLAQALLGNPELLILDEPINGLDPIGIAEVRGFIRELCDATGKTILISSHILSEISLLADDIGIIDHGVLLEEESLEELEAKNGKYFRFTVSNAAAAGRLLYERLGIHDMTVDSANELTVRDLHLDTAQAISLFVGAGLTVSDAHLYEDTLEDYFKKVTGGEGIA